MMFLLMKLMLFMKLNIKILNSVPKSKNKSIFSTKSQLKNANIF